MKRILLVFLGIFLAQSSTQIEAQILFSESFNVIIDTNKKISGSILPDFKFQTQKKNLIEFDNLADISFRIDKKNAITLANKMELSMFGKETFLSGGYLYGEYRRIFEKKLVVEPFSQIQWAEARGMEWKFAGGINLRYRILVKEKIALFAGVGPFYEFERWNYKGVPDSIVIPPNTPKLKNESIKLGTYISCKIYPFERLKLDISLYHQARFNELFSTPRLASSVLARFSITKHLGFNLGHQFIYDFKPVVPVRKDFHRIIVGISVNF